VSVGYSLKCEDVHVLNVGWGNLRGASKLAVVLSTLMKYLAPHKCELYW